MDLLREIIFEQNKHILKEISKGYSFDNDEEKSL